MCMRIYEYRISGVKVSDALSYLSRGIAAKWHRCTDLVLSEYLSKLDTFENATLSHRVNTALDVK